MATNFPTSVDDASTVGDDTHPSADEALSSTVGGPAHHALHQNVGLAINAIEDKVGTGASTPAANTVLTGTGSGTSAWATVSTAMIGDDQVTQAKIADDAVGADQLAANAVVTASIVDDQVTQAKIAAGAVGTTELGADAVTGAKIANDAVAAEHLATDSVTADAIATGAVGTAEIAADAVTADKIATNAVGNDQLIASPTFTNITGTLLTAAQPNITSVGTLTSVASSGAITGNSVSVVGSLEAGGTVSSSYASATTPSYNFSGDTNTGMYRSAADEISFATNGTQRVKISSGGLLIWVTSSGIGGPLTDTSSTSGFRYVLQNQTYGTFWDFTSIRDRKEQITNVTATDSGRWIDGLQPVTFIERWLGEGDEPADNRTYREADVQVGFIADDVLSNPDTSHFAQATDNGEGGLDPAGWKWECVIAAAVAEIKSLRARVATLEGN